jgi:hypothetical protein
VSNDRAATFRNSQGEVIGTTWAGTVCWYPRKPSMLAAVSADGKRETALPCGFCSGCRELTRQRLAHRLVKHYSDVKEPLWLLEVTCPSSRMSRLFRSLRPTTTFQGYAGWARNGSTGVAIIVKGAREAVPARLFAKFPTTRCQRLSKPQRTKTWWNFTRGVLVSRDEYGGQVNRFYHRGLPPAETEKWGVVTRGGIRKRHAAVGVGVRAVDGDVSLHPPTAWLLPRLLKRKGPESKRISALAQFGTILGSLLDNLPGKSTREPSTINQQARVSAPSYSSMPGMVSPKAPASLKTRPLVPKGMGYRSSNQPVSEKYLEWGRRMAEKARARERGS